MKYAAIPNVMTATATKPIAICLRLMPDAPVHVSRPDFSRTGQGSSIGRGRWCVAPGQNIAIDVFEDIAERCIERGLRFVRAVGPVQARIGASVDFLFRRRARAVVAHAHNNVGGARVAGWSRHIGLKKLGADDEIGGLVVELQALVPI